MVIKVNNLNQCVAKFGDMSGIDFTPEIIEGTRKVQTSAVDLAPNNTGFTPSGEPSKGVGDLKRSIKSKLYNRGKPNVTGIVYTGLEHAFYNEFGTRKMEAQPFMIPAMNQQRLGINQSMKKYLRDQLRKKSS